MTFKITFFLEIKNNTF